MTDLDELLITASFLSLLSTVLFKLASWLDKKVDFDEDEMGFIFIWVAACGLLIVAVVLFGLSAYGYWWPEIAGLFRKP